MKKHNQAFTLVELIVVITILAILGTIAFISLQGYSASSRDSVRISDVSNMKTSLELFHLNAGKYPLPDGKNIVSYELLDLRYQGTFGSGVVSQLSRNMSKAPKDPLTEREYVFSTANNKNEFEILTLLEGDIALNKISQTNAATLSVTPKIDGNYNGVFVKTATHIVPTPSIINAEVNGATLILNNTNIKSQVTNLGKNIPNILSINYNTGALTGLELINISLPAVDASNTIKASVITSIQAAYTGAIDLVNNDIYKYILSVSGESELAGVFDTIVLNKVVISVNSVQNEYSSSITYIIGQSFTYNGIKVNVIGNGYGTIEGTKNLHTPICDKDDIVVWQNLTDNIQVWAACNQGSMISSNSGNGSYGYYFQWGNNYGFPTLGNVIQDSNPIDASLYGPLNPYNSSTFMTGSTWSSVQNDNLWGQNGDVIAKKGPCTVGYHVPTQIEWQLACDITGCTDTGPLNMANPGIRMWWDGNYLDGQSSYGYYWTSDTNGGNSIYLQFAGGGSFVGTYNTVGATVRCVKN